MPYMGSSIRPSEELRAGMVEADNICSICRGKVWTQCDNCEHDICQECTVKCAGCDSDNEYCLACAIKRGYVETAGVFRCEECQHDRPASCGGRAMISYDPKCEELARHFLDEA